MATITGISPNPIPQNYEGTITMTGTGFANNAPVLLFEDTSSQPVNVVSDTELNWLWEMFYISVGTWDVTYEDGDSNTGFLADAITVTAIETPSADAPIVNVGTTSDDGTGDTVRLAFQKLNATLQDILKRMEDHGIPPS